MKRVYSHLQFAHRAKLLHCLHAGSAAQPVMLLSHGACDAKSPFPASLFHLHLGTVPRGPCPFVSGASCEVRATLTMSLDAQEKEHTLSGGCSAWGARIWDAAAAAPCLSSWMGAVAAATSGLRMCPAAAVSDSPSSHFSVCVCVCVFCLTASALTSECVCACVRICMHTHVFAFLHLPL